MMAELNSCNRDQSGPQSLKYFISGSLYRKALLTLVLHYDYLTIEKSGQLKTVNPQSITDSNVFFMLFHLFQQQKAFTFKQ